MVCAASGPSLSAADLEYCRGRGWPIWAINDSWRLGCDGIYACDGKWWDANPEATRAAAEKWTQDRAASERYGLNWILSIRQTGFSENPRWVHQGHNSGFQLLNLIYLMGAARVILLGYDMRPIGRRIHWHGDHSGMLCNPSDINFIEFRQAFETIQPLRGCEVFNCTPGSAIRRFPIVELHAVL